MKYERILITGAAGKLGRHLRATLKPLSRTVRLTDIVPMAPAGANEEVVEADLLDESSVADLMAGVDVVIHLAGIIVEQPFPQILQANIVGSHNVWEAACAAGVKRMVYASSCHAVGMYPRNERLDADSTHRPDSFYGLSKAFGEDLARLYFDKHGMEAACLRIGSCFEEATDERMLATWLSRADLTRLVETCLDAPVLGYAILYGMSDNPKTWWDNSKVDYLGYRPQDSAQQFTEKLAATNEPFDPADPVKFYQAGQFAADVRRR